MVNMMNINTPADSAYKLLKREIARAEHVGKDGYCNIPAAFDVEASSFLDSEDKKVGLCYIWMFGIGDTVVYGRTLREYKDLLDRLDKYLYYKSAKLIIYVHNLQYDFSFIRKYFDWDEVFLHGPRQPLFAKYRTLEFRDSLILSGGYSLKSIGEKLRRPVQKAVGDLDYNLVRTPETPMTEQELHYCEMDIRVLLEYIREKIEDDGNISKIPYTNTGYVRSYVRDKCFEMRERYLQLMDKLTITPDGYLQAEQAFMGGAVGPNIKYVKQVCENVHSYDIKSSYPYVIATGYYPMSFFMPVKNEDAQRDFESLIIRYCCMFDIEIFNLVPKTDYCFPISYSKCHKTIGARIASGRVMRAAYVSMTLTELDYQTIARFYDLEQADEIRISRMRISNRGYLPSPIVKSALKFFFDKTELDGVEGREREYMVSKNMLNAIYGMMVEKVVRDVLTYSKDFEKGKRDYEKQVDAYNNKRKRFLYYPWGVWVTAHARSRLYDAIYNIGDDWRYCDTDSVKFINNHSDYFDRVNAEVRYVLARTAERLAMKFEDIVPRAPDGTLKYMGVWEHEYDALRFKTIGAKRYMVQYHSGDYALTAAGTNKKLTLEYLLQQAAATEREVFDLFDEGLRVPAEYSRRSVLTYIDSERNGYVVDYTGQRHWYTAPSGVYFEMADYQFGDMTDMMEAIDWLTRDAEYQEGEY